MVLHGYSQNGTIFSKRLGAIRKEFGKSIELVFIDAPHVMHPVDLPGTTAINALESIGAAEAANADTDLSLTPRAWWKFDAERTKAHGIEESLEHVKKVLVQRKFDGVLGFSQGAALAAVVAALLERPHLYPPFLVDGEPPHPPMYVSFNHLGLRCEISTIKHGQFCVAVSGYKLRDPIIDPLFDTPFMTPTLHVIGKTDIIVVEERSMLLVEASGNARVEEHEGGHFVPSKGAWRKFLCEYIMDPFADIPSPDLSSSSVPNSGFVTPING